MRIPFRITGLLIIAGCGGPTTSNSSSADTAFYTPADFAAVEKIDAHVHIRSSDTTFAQQAKRDNYRLLTIAVDEPPGLEAQEQFGITQMQLFPQQVSFAATFSLDGWGRGDWSQKTIAHLQSAIDQGAVGVKFYKNIGMELRDPDGRFVMIDDPRFDTVLHFLTAHNITVIGHFGEPKDCWLPLDKMLMNTNRKYYTRHPEYHMFLHPDYPSYHEQIAARNRMLKKHPQLRFVGAHLGSQEWDTDTLAMHLDGHPNMAADMAARISSLQFLTMKNHQKVRDFFIRYQDRLLYGTDRISDNSKPSAEEAAFIHDAWLRDWAFFTGSDTLRSSAFDGAFKGLQLPKTVVDKIYWKNAAKWFRGLAR
ncbi:hydrolase [Chitinophaga lutea]|uniref:Hydrolase n=1 Tax=Chitinophaga lutea TaxID=2488634 RepID=A0A3N4PXD3_9BACT|nr:amidohydrolase family protein [Chitinophaga lutea]RPE12576.1 hydrolase [Chitinophaga lutea]